MTSVRVIRTILVLLVTAGLSAAATSCRSPHPSDFAPFSSTDLVVGTGGSAQTGNLIDVNYTRLDLTTRRRQTRKARVCDDRWGHRAALVHARRRIGDYGLGSGHSGMRVGGVTGSSSRRPSLQVSSGSSSERDAESSKSRSWPCSSGSHRYLPDAGARGRDVRFPRTRGGAIRTSRIRPCRRSMLRSRHGLSLRVPGLRVDRRRSRKPEFRAAAEEPRPSLGSERQRLGAARERFGRAVTQRLRHRIDCLRRR